MQKPQFCRSWFNLVPCNAKDEEVRGTWRKPNANDINNAKVRYARLLERDKLREEGVLRVNTLHAAAYAPRRGHWLAYSQQLGARACLWSTRVILSRPVGGCPPAHNITVCSLAYACLGLSQYLHWSGGTLAWF